MTPQVILTNICDNREKAWIVSRPMFDHSDFDLDLYGSMDIGFNSLCTLTFEITSSIIFRDLLLTIRPIAAWARSSRATPFKREHMEISAEFKGLASEDGIDEAIARVEAGEPQDTARESLPMTMSTKFTVSMDFRTVCGLVKMLKEVDADLYNIYGKKFVTAIKDIPGFKKNRVPSFSDKYLPNTQELKRMSGLDLLHDFVSGAYIMKMAFMSQFIRNTHASIKSGLWLVCKKEGYMNLSSMMQGDRVPVYFYMNSGAYDGLMCMRSHWFADWSEDMWGSMVGDYIEGMTVEEFWKWIPSGDGKKDPYEHDMLHRIKCEDPNLPCPIALENPLLIHERVKLFGMNPVVAKYMELFIEGFVKDNPDNKLRKQYEFNKANKQDSEGNVHH